MLAPDSKPSMLLQQPGRMGPLRLKNRVVMGPMGTNFGTTDGFSTERDKIYYARAGSRTARMRPIAWRTLSTTSGARSRSRWRPARGSVVLEGDPRTLAASPQLKDAYLGMGSGPRQPGRGPLK